MALTCLLWNRKNVKVCFDIFQVKPRKLRRKEMYSFNKFNCIINTVRVFTDIYPMWSYIYGILWLVWGYIVCNHLVHPSVVCYTFFLVTGFSPSIGRKLRYLVLMRIGFYHYTCICRELWFPLFSTVTITRCIFQCVLIRSFFQLNMWKKCRTC